MLIVTTELSADKLIVFPVTSPVTFVQSVEGVVEAESVFPFAHPPVELLIVPFNLYREIPVGYVIARIGDSGESSVEHSVQNLSEKIEGGL